MWRNSNVLLPTETRREFDLYLVERLSEDVRHPSWLQGQYTFCYVMMIYLETPKIGKKIRVLESPEHLKPLVPAPSIFLVERIPSRSTHIIAGGPCNTERQTHTNWIAQRPSLRYRCSELEGRSRSDCHVELPMHNAVANWTSEEECILADAENCLIEAPTQVSIFSAWGTKAMLRSRISKLRIWGVGGIGYFLRSKVILTYEFVPPHGGIPNAAKSDPRPKLYNHKGLQNAESHLFRDHSGIVDPSGKRLAVKSTAAAPACSIATLLRLNPEVPRDQEIKNVLIKLFDKTAFQQMIVNWIVSTNRSFTTAKDPDLRAIFEYLNPSVSITEAHISDVTVRAIAVREFNENKWAVRETLRKSPGQIHIQFDGWRSGNRHFLYGVICIFRSLDNRPRKKLHIVRELEISFRPDNWNPSMYCVNCRSLHQIRPCGVSYSRHIVFGATHVRRYQIMSLTRRIFQIAWLHGTDQAQDASLVPWITTSPGPSSRCACFFCLLKLFLKISTMSFSNSLRPLPLVIGIRPYKWYNEPVLLQLCFANSVVISVDATASCSAIRVILPPGTIVGGYMYNFFTGTTVYGTPTTQEIAPVFSKLLQCTRAVPIGHLHPTVEHHSRTERQAAAILGQGGNRLRATTRSFGPYPENSEATSHISVGEITSIKRELWAMREEEASGKHNSAAPCHSDWQSNDSVGIEVDSEGNLRDFVCKDNGAGEPLLTSGSLASNSSGSSYRDEKTGIDDYGARKYKSDKGPRRHPLQHGSKRYDELLLAEGVGTRQDESGMTWQADAERGCLCISKSARKEMEDSRRECEAHKWENAREKQTFLSTDHLIITPILTPPSAKMTKTGTSTQRTILREPQDWDKWIKELKAHTDKTIHKLLFDEDNSPLEPPHSAYAAMFSQYESLRKEYLYETKLITAARTVITESISPAKLTSLREDESLYEWIKKLEDSTAPSRGFMADRIRSQYTAHLRSFSKQTVSSWLAKWEEIIEQADQYFLVEALTGQWLRDIALLIRPLSDGTATSFKNASKLSTESTKSYARDQMFPFVVKHLTIEISHKNDGPSSQLPGRSESWSKNNAQKRKASPASDEEENEDQDRCPACKRTGHELKGCWLVFEDRRPSYSRKAPKRIADKIKRVIGESPDLQKKIEEIKAAFVFSSGTTAASSDYPLRRSSLLDSGASLHICNDLSRFRSFKKAKKDYVVTGESEVRIEGYGKVNYKMTMPDGSYRKLKLKNVAYCPRFSTSLISFNKLLEEGIHWDTLSKPTRLVQRNKTIGILLRKHHQFGTSTKKQSSKLQRGLAQETLVQQPKETAIFGTHALEKLESRCHEELPLEKTSPAMSHNDFVRVMFITDAFSGMVFPILCGHFVSWMKEHFGFAVKIIRSDGELFTKKIRSWLRKKGISAAPSAPNTQAQNGGAERSGGVTTERARVMRIASKLPHDLWKEIVEAACYLRNRTPRKPKVPSDLRGASQSWKSPIELFTGKTAQLAHLRAYGCKAYAMTSNAQLKRKRLQKLDPRAHIGYLVGYNSTNIFRIWIPSLRKVISTRDVIFDEYSYFDGKLPQQQLSDSIGELVQEIEIAEDQQAKEVALDEETDTESDIEEFYDDFEDEDRDQEQEKGDYEKALELEEASLLTPPASEEEEDTLSAFSVQLPVATPEGVDNETFSPDIPAVFTTLLQKAREASEQTGIDQEDQLFDRFADFIPTPVEDGCHGAFTAGRQFRPTPKKMHKRDLPDPPMNQKQLQRHPFKEEFMQAQRDHLASHEEMGSFEEVPRKKAGGQQVLGCQWVFVYKTDKHGILRKCKARLVVCGNQQEKGDLPTRATTLAGMSFRTLMALAAEYDLELDQMDAINAFVNCPLEEEEVVFMKMPSGFERRGKVLRLRKALYGLRRSPLLWQQHLTASLEKLGFKTVPQEPCVMMKGAVIVFFYVDDIIWAYRKLDQQITTEAISGLQQRYKMSILGNQNAYIDKIAHKYVPDKLGIKLPSTPMATNEELLSEPIQARDQDKHSYLQKTRYRFCSLPTSPLQSESRPDTSEGSRQKSRLQQRFSSVQVIHLLQTIQICRMESIKASYCGYIKHRGRAACSFRSIKGSHLPQQTAPFFATTNPVAVGYGMLIYTNTGYVRKCKEAEYALVGFQQLKCEPMEIGERLRLEARLEELKDKIKDCREHRMRPPAQLRLPLQLAEGVGTRQDESGMTWQADERGCLCISKSARKEMEDSRRECEAHKWENGMRWICFVPCLIYTHFRGLKFSSKYGHYRNAAKGLNSLSLDTLGIRNLSRRRSERSEASRFLQVIQLETSISYSNGIFQGVRYLFYWLGDLKRLNYRPNSLESYDLRGLQ
ncbi:reverse transcriptase (RNA-dependent DNA polymerase) [Hirsutella rhossiliensis]